MGVNLFDEYDKNMYDIGWKIPLLEYYKDRARLLKEARQTCPHYLVHACLTHPETQRAKDQIRWCDENLRGRYFASMEVEAGIDGETDWIICFEFEDDEAAFKLMWK